MKPVTHIMVSGIQDQILHFMRLLLAHQVDRHLITAVIHASKGLETAKTIVVDLIPAEFHEHRMGLFFAF